MILDAKAFEEHGSKLLYVGKGLKSSRFDRRFAAAFGMEPVDCASVWNMVEVCRLLTEKDRHPKHFLWTLIFLRVYPKEELLSALAESHENTTRKWVWRYVDALTGLEEYVVSKKNTKIRRSFVEGTNSPFVPLPADPMDESIRTRQRVDLSCYS